MYILRPVYEFLNTNLYKLYSLKLSINLYRVKYSSVCRVRASLLKQHNKAIGEGGDHSPHTSCSFLRNLFCFGLFFSTLRFPVHPFSCFLFVIAKIRPVVNIISIAYIQTYIQGFDTAPPPPPRMLKK